ncbi:protein of unknown function [Thauera humireducens]|nr:protein of unknown function [Thauera humireducens]
MKYRELRCDRCYHGHTSLTGDTEN